MESPEILLTRGARKRVGKSRAPLPLLVTVTAKLKNVIHTMASLKEFGVVICGRPI